MKTYSIFVIFFWVELQLTAHGAFKQLLFCIHLGSDLLCSLSLCAKPSQLQIFSFHPKSQPFKMCISWYLALWAKEVFIKFERWSGVFCVERTGQTLNSGIWNWILQLLSLVTQESNKKIRKQRLHGKLEHAGIAVMVQVKARFLHVSSEDWMTQIVKSHHRAGSTSYKAILCLEAKIQLLLPNLFFSFRSYHPLTLPMKASVSVHGKEPAALMGCCTEI